LVVPRLGPGADEYARKKASEVTATTHKKLRTVIDLHGSLPSQYRSLGWRFMLRLPANVPAYEDLCARGEHAAWKNLESQYPVKDRRMLVRLARLVNALAHWSPVFGELPFLPALVFPFVKFYGSDELAAFETVMTILINWTPAYIETLPHPPVPLLARVHVLLSYWDAPLAQHLEECGSDPSRYAWPILRSLFSEVLTRTEWEALWDRLMLESHDPSYLVYALVAYLRYIRGTFLAVAPNAPGPSPHPGARNTAAQANQVALSSGKFGFNGKQELAGHVVTPPVAEISAIVRHQNAIHLPSVLKMMLDMRKKTPEWAHPYPQEAATAAAQPHPTASALRSTGPVSSPPTPTIPTSLTGTPGTSASTQQFEQLVVGFPNRGPLHGLSSGAYPAFLRYPRAVVDHAIAERERIAIEEANLSKKKALADLLARRTAELAAEEEAWRLERKVLEATESKRAQEEETLTLLRERESARLEAEIRGQRLAAVASLQLASKESLATQRARRAVIASRSEAEKVRLARTRDELLRKRINEEALLSLELQAMQHARALDEEREAEEADAVATTTIEHRSKAQQLADELLGEAWRLEDEERRVLRAAEASEAAKVGHCIPLT
jgi:hypothetical protein